MSLYGHGVISPSVLLAGLNLSVSLEFMKTCELGLAVSKRLQSNSSK